MPEVCAQRILLTRAAPCISRVHPLLIGTDQGWLVLHHFRIWKARDNTCSRREAMADGAAVDDDALAALAECFPDAAPAALAAALCACGNDASAAIDWFLASEQADDGPAPCGSGADLDDAALPSHLRDAYWRARRAFPAADGASVAAVVCAHAHEDARRIFAGVCRDMVAGGHAPPAPSAAVPRRLRTERLRPSVACARSLPLPASGAGRGASLEERLQAYFAAHGPPPDCAPGDMEDAAEALRVRAAETHAARAAASGRAQTAHASGGHTGLGAAAHYSDRARVLRAQAVALNRAAACLVFRARNPAPGARVLDLHSLTVDEAAAVLGIHLDCLAIAPHAPLRVVTGAGRHSGRSGARLRPAVHRLLVARGASFTHDDMASFLVTHCPRANGP